LFLEFGAKISIFKENTPIIIVLYMGKLYQKLLFGGIFYKKSDDFASKCTIKRKTYR